MGNLMTPENWRRLVFQQLADFLGVVDGEAGGHGYLLDADSILLNLRVSTWVVTWRIIPVSKCLQSQVPYF